MALSKATPETLLQAQQFECIRFVFSDLNGIPRGKNVMKNSLEKYLKNGVDFYYACLTIGPRNELKFDLPGIAESNLGNMTILPADEKIYKLPWAGGKHQVGEIICETAWKGEYQAAGPRTICRRQVERLGDLGYSIYSAFECEFILTKYGDPSTPLNPNHMYGSVRTMAEYEPFLLEMNSQLVEAGIEPDLMQCEYTGSQIEISLTPRYGLATADMTFRFKEAVKEIAATDKFAEATFMTKPDTGANCSGFHFNHSLWTKDGKSALYDPSSKDNLSPVATHWVAGLLKHARAITALCSPTFNCYRRLHNPWCPHQANWGIDNRNTCFRVKNTGPSGTYIENRLPSAACSPHLVMAATIAAGLDGIEKRLELPQEYDTDAEEIPHTLEEALTALKEDVELSSALGKEFMDWFVPIKEDFEINKFKTHNVKQIIEEEIVKEQEEYFMYI